MSAIYIVRCLMKKKPMTVFIVGYFITLFYFAYTVRICERSLIRNLDREDIA